MAFYCPYKLDLSIRYLPWISCSLSPIDEIHYIKQCTTFPRVLYGLNFGHKINKVKSERDKGIAFSQEDCPSISCHRSPFWGTSISQRQ
ncbi:hypothetical protein KCU61_g761, partial [Aureobasidium melanogenum]